MRRPPIPINRARVGFTGGWYKGAEVGDGFKADIVVAGALILEIKAGSTILPIYEVQLRTGPRWPGLTLGLTRPCA